MIFSNRFGYVAAKRQDVYEWWIEKDIEGNGRGLFSGTTLSFALRDWGILQMAVRLVGLRAENWVRDLTNMK
jgi:hypothetical protein